METGCYIDGSHVSSFNFTVAVIDFAISNGFEIEEETYRKDIDNVRNGNYEDVPTTIQDDLDWTYEDALEYLNSTAPDNLLWTVEDNSLFLEEYNEEDL